MSPSDARSHTPGESDPEVVEMDVEQLVQEEYEEPIARRGHDRLVPNRVFFFAQADPRWHVKGEETHGCVYVDHYNPSGHVRSRTEALAIAHHYGVALIERCVNCGGDAVCIDGEAWHLPPHQTAFDPEPCAKPEIFLGVPVAA